MIAMIVMMVMMMMMMMKMKMEMEMKMKMMNSMLMCNDDIILRNITLYTSAFSRGFFMSSETNYQLKNRRWAYWTKSSSFPKLDMEPSDRKLQNTYT